MNMEIFGWMSLLLVGITLGLLGGGGAILTVPILAYLFTRPVVESTSLSLFIVGVASLIGSVGYIRNRLFDSWALLCFGLPSIIGVTLSRAWILPSLPPVLPGGIDRGMALMLFLALLMVGAGIRMLQPRPSGDVKVRRDVIPVALAGLTVGLIAGIVGAGGGFLIIPALYFLVGLKAKVAVGTSLTIIATQSIIGFGTDLLQRSPDWSFLLPAAGVAIMGTFVGVALAKRANEQAIRKGFGVLTLTVAAFIVLRELL
jgi:uncharacterized protein